MWKNLYERTKNLEQNMRIKYKDIKVKKVYLLLACSIILVSAGCGYNMGPIANPQIKSIALAPIKNDSVMPNVSEYMRSAIAEAFQIDGAYKVRSVYDADCILYGKVLSTKVTSVDVRSATDGVIFQTRQFNMSIEFQYTVVIPGQADALVATTTITGDAQFMSPVDQFVARQNGIKQAAWNAANQVVWGCTESW